MSESSERFSTLTLPSVQFPVPDASVETRLMRHVLVAWLLGFGIASGGPKRQPGFPGYSGFATPAAVQFRLLPVSASVAAPRVRAPVKALQPVMLTMGV